MKNIIKVLRAQNNLTQEELAKKIGITRQALSNIENGKVIPSGKIVIKIANFFRIPAEKIFFEDDVIHEKQENKKEVS
jgi:putative transcriptional regulator